MFLSVTGNSIKTSGKLELKQTDFSIEPIYLLGGMLAVQDSVMIEFNINAKLITYQPDVSTVIQ
jgi:hypothetical protein